MSMNLSPNAPPPLPVGPNQAMTLVHQLQDAQLMHVAQDKANPQLQQAALMELMNRQQLRGGSPAQGQPGPGTPPGQQFHPPIPPQGQNTPQPPPGPGGGVAQLPAPAVEGMAAGGIVAFDEGGPTTGGYMLGPNGEKIPYGPTTQNYGVRTSPTDANPDNQTAMYKASSLGRVPPSLLGALGFTYNGAPMEGTAPPVRDMNRTAPPPANTPPSQYPYNGPPADRPLPEEAQNTPPTPDSMDYMTGLLGQYGPGGYGKGLQNPADETLAKQMAATEAAKRANTGLSWLHAGAAMLQSTSPFAAVALGKGVDAYATSKEAGQAAEQAGLAHIAQTQTEGYKSNMQYAGQVDAVRMHMIGLTYMQQMTERLKLTQQEQETAAKTYGDEEARQFANIKPLLDKLSPLVSSDPTAAMQYDAAIRGASARAVTAAQQNIERTRGITRPGNFAGSQTGQPLAPSNQQFQHGLGTPPQQ